MFAVVADFHYMGLLQKALASAVFLLGTIGKNKTIVF